MADVDSAVAEPKRSRARKPRIARSPDVDTELDSPDPIEIAMKAVADAAGMAGPSHSNIAAIFLWCETNGATPSATIVRVPTALHAGAPFTSAGPARCGASAARTRPARNCAWPREWILAMLTGRACGL